MAVVPVAGLPAVDVVIVTALAEERDAVVAVLDCVHTRQHLGRDVSTGEVGNARVAVESLHGMGNVGAGVAAGSLLTAWRAQHLLLVGIAGGIGNAGVRHGDVVVPDQIVGYESAKLTAGGPERRPEVYRPDFDLLAAAASVSPGEWVPAIRAPRPVLGAAPRAHIGTVLSGEKVIADAAVLADLRRAWPKAVGVEMESFGTALAAYRGGGRFLMVKGVSDLADEDKDDRWHEYAAEAAARYAVAVLRRQPGPAASAGRALAGSAPDLTIPGRIMVSICWRLVNDWSMLARCLEIPPHEVARFRHGDEPGQVWEWLLVRRRLHELPAALAFIGREDLAEELLRAA